MWSVPYCSFPPFLASTNRIAGLSIYLAKSEKKFALENYFCDIWIKYYLSQSFLDTFKFLICLHWTWKIYLRVYQTGWLNSFPRFPHDFTLSIRDMFFLWLCYVLPAKLREYTLPDFKSLDFRHRDMRQRSHPVVRVIFRYSTCRGTSFDKNICRTLIMPPASQWYLQKEWKMVCREPSHLRILQPYGFQRV